jgi:hypothetical protein
MPRILCYLRIAFSATCLIACVLLIAWWIRSYWRGDFLYLELTATQAVEFGSFKASVLFVEFFVSRVPPTPPIRFRTARYDVEPHWQYVGFQLEGDRSGTRLGLPHWFLVIVSATFAAIPWIRWRFSLRTLLIATTIVALVLGLTIYATRG